MVIINCFLTVLFALLALLANKYPSIISGFNYTPDSIKPQVKQLTVRMLLVSAVGIAVLTALFSVIGLSGVWEIVPILFPFLVSMFTCIKLHQIGALSKMKFIVVIVSIILTIAVIFGLLIVGIKEPAITLSADKIEISGIYGRDIKVADIEAVELQDNTPKNTFKNNGFAIGKVKKGHFKVENEGYCLLFLSNDGKCIRLKTKNDVIYFNFAEISRTENLYESLKNSIGK